MSWLSQIGVCVGFWQFQVIPVFEDQAIKVSRTYRKNAEALQDAKVRVIRGAAFMRIATGYMIELALPGNESDQFQDMLRDPLHERWIDPTFKEDLERALSSELLRIKQSVQNIASQMMSLAATLELDLSIIRGQLNTQAPSSDFKGLRTHRKVLSLSSKARSIKDTLILLQESVGTFSDAVGRAVMPSGSTLVAAEQRIAGLYPNEIPWRQCQNVAWKLHAAFNMGESKCRCTKHNVRILLEHKVLPITDQGSARRREIAIVQDTDERHCRATVDVSCAHVPRVPLKKHRTSIVPGRNTSKRPEEDRGALFVCCDALSVDSESTPLHLEICTEMKGGDQRYVRRKDSEALRRGAAPVGHFSSVEESRISALDRSKLAVTAASSTLQLGHLPWLARLWHLSELRFFQPMNQPNTTFDRPFIVCPKPGDSFVMRFEEGSNRSKGRAAMLSLAITLTKLSCSGPVRQETQVSTIETLWKQGLNKVLTHLHSILNNMSPTQTIAPRNLNAIRACLRAFAKRDFSVENEEDATMVLESVIWPLQMQTQQMFGRHSAWP